MSLGNESKDIPSSASAVQRRRADGFTLIEMMIVVLIVGVLAAIAYASYQRSVVETRRKAATACLQEGAQFMERWYTTRLTYVGADPAPGCENDLAPFYAFPLPAGVTATAYTLTADPVNGQEDLDTVCGDLGLNQTGIRTESGSAASAAECW